MSLTKASAGQGDKQGNFYTMPRGMQIDKTIFHIIEQMWR